MSWTVMPGMSWMTVFLIGTLGGVVGGFLGMMGYAVFSRSGTISQCEEAYEDGYREAQERFREQLEKIGARDEAGEERVRDDQAEVPAERVALG